MGAPLPGLKYWFPMQRFDRLRRVGDGRAGVPRGMIMQVFERSTESKDGMN